MPLRAFGLFGHIVNNVPRISYPLVLMPLRAFGLFGLQEVNRG